MNDRPTLDEIRARCALPVTELVNNPREYLRVQTILRDRAELLRLLDECMAERANLRAEVSQLTFSRDLLAGCNKVMHAELVGMRAAINQIIAQDDLALAEEGYREGFANVVRIARKVLVEIIGVDLAKGPDQTVTHLVRTPAYPGEHAWTCECGNENGPMFLKCGECRRVRPAVQQTAPQCAHRKGRYVMDCLRAALAGAERGEVPACESRCADERCRRTGDCQKPGNCIAPDQPGRSQPASVGHPVCQSCGAFVDSRGKCRIPEHNP